MQLHGVGITLGLPSRYLFGHSLCVVDTPLETLAVQAPNLDLGHMQPTRVLGGVVKRQPGQQASCFVRGKGLVQGRPRVRVQVVQDPVDRYRHWGVAPCPVQQARSRRNRGVRSPGARIRRPRGAGDQGLAGQPPVLVAQLSDQGARWQSFVLTRASSQGISNLRAIPSPKLANVHGLL